MNTPHGEPLPPSDVFRLNDLHQHVAASLILLAEGGRIYSRRPDATAAAHRRARQLLVDLSRLLAALKEGQADHDVPPAAGDRQ